MFVLVAVVCMTVVSGFMRETASAQSSYLDAFTDFNNWTVGTKLDNCITCHVSGSTTRNTYGQEIETVMLQNPLYSIYNAMSFADGYDSDGDEWPNWVEIDGIYFPGDPTDYPECVDNDGDGFPPSTELRPPCSTIKDCNDNDAEMFPGNPEVCFNSKNNDCDSYVEDNTDPDCSSACTDSDDDGYSVEGGICGPVDCNDNDPDINPAACDIKKDGIDQNCDGSDRTSGKPCQ